MGTENAEAKARLARALDRIAPRDNKAFARQPPPVDVTTLRVRLGMTQEQFAARFGFPVATLRHWERGNRTPRGAARVLLNVIAREPRAVMRALTPY